MVTAAGPAPFFPAVVAGTVLVLIVGVVSWGGYLVEDFFEADPWLMSLFELLRRASRDCGHGLRSGRWNLGRHLSIVRRRGAPCRRRGVRSRYSSQGRPGEIPQSLPLSPVLSCLFCQPPLLLPVRSSSSFLLLLPFSLPSIPHAPQLNLVSPDNTEQLLHKLLVVLPLSLKASDLIEQRLDLLLFERGIGR